MTFSIPKILTAIAIAIAMCLPFTTAAQVTVSLTLLPNQNLSVEYKLPPHCAQLRFDKTGLDAAKIRAQWQQPDQCFTADGDKLKANQATCTHARFTVPVSTRKISGYPAAFPMAETVYLHTSNYHVEDSCGAVNYEISAPYIALEGKQVRDHTVVMTKGDYTFPALLSPRPFKLDSGVISYIDPSLSTATKAHITEVGEMTIAFLKNALPKAPFNMPIIVAANVKHAGSTGYDGDAGNVLRLSLLNWPDIMGAREKNMITSFVSHEFSHRFQLRDAVDIYPQARLIHEAGAEFLRWTTALNQGWMSHQEAAADLDEALGKCFLGTLNAPWGSLSARYIGERQLEYRCGLAVYIYGLAARQNKQTAMDNFGDFYQHIHEGNKPDFADAIECGDQADCHPQWLPQLFGGTRPMQTVWREFLTSTAMAKEVAPNQGQVDLMIKKAFSQLMVDDCGESSYFEAVDGLIVDELKACKTLKKDMKVIGVEGHPLYGNRQALPALSLACKNIGKVRLGIENAPDLMVPCKTVYQPITSFYAVDIEKVLRLLNQISHSNLR
jgi:hypothetical protein